ncbi:hypothetical protein VU06_04210, partial [Desulfobulbus sp. F3]|nr:hypothetical protein [Desulfobulbus sp. F3]
MKILKTDKFLMLNGGQLTDFRLKKSLRQESQEQSPSQKYGFRSILKKRDEVRRHAFRMSKDGIIFMEVGGRRTFAGSKENDIWIRLASERS